MIPSPSADPNLYIIGLLITGLLGLLSACFTGFLAVQTARSQPKSKQELDDAQSAEILRKANEKMASELAKMRAEELAHLQSECDETNAELQKSKEELEKTNEELNKVKTGLIVVTSIVSPANLEVIKTVVQPYTAP